MRIKKIITLLKKLYQRFNKEATKTTLSPKIIPRSDHTITRKAIHPNALKVLYRLHQSGYQAYLVGGCVRDLLFGLPPKDFDIATNARPEEIRRLFRNCRLIGRRFRLAHILFGKEIIEVATFRTHHDNAAEHHAKSYEGMIIRDNVYGNIEDDAWRRDFSINALYYNIADFSIVDYTGGMDDVAKQQLRMIGDPEKRFTEDPVRLLRAVRFLGKLNIAMHPETEAQLTRLSHLLAQVSSARLFQEVLKLFEGQAIAKTFHLLQKYHLFNQLFPLTGTVLTQPLAQQLINEALDNTDQRLAANKSISPVFLMTVFLWPVINQQAANNESQGAHPYHALENALDNVLYSQTQRLAIPRKLLISIREICLLQHYFINRHGTRPYRSLEHPRFRAAYDLLLLRAKIGEPVQALAEWWIEFYTSEPEHREQLIKKMTHPAKPKKQRRRKK